jgi:hypothetical protein
LHSGVRIQPSIIEQLIGEAALTATSNVDPPPADSALLGRTGALVKAVWGVAVTLLGVAGAIFWAGVNWAALNTKVDAIELLNKKVSSLQTVYGTDDKFAPAGGANFTVCAKGYVIVGIQVGTEKGINIRCGLLVDTSRQ